MVVSSAVDERIFLVSLGAKFRKSNRSYSGIVIKDAFKGIHNTMFVVIFTYLQTCVVAHSIRDANTGAHL